jgi:hypothetical protein
MDLSIWDTSLLPFSPFSFDSLRFFTALIVLWSWKNQHSFFTLPSHGQRRSRRSQVLQCNAAVIIVQLFDISIFFPSQPKRGNNICAKTSSLSEWWSLGEKISLALAFKKREIFLMHKYWIFNCHSAD